MSIVECKNIKKHFPILRGYRREKVGIVKAVDDVSLEIKKGETFGLVGESGCGKTTIGKIILGIIKPDSGRIILSAQRPQVIFQDPYNSLDPKMRVREILAEGLVLQDRRQGTSLGFARDRRDKIQEILDLVKLPKSSVTKYPHEFSGGERQRIAIGRAVLTEPEFIVCDEPVSSLDVTIQLEILKLLKNIQKRFSITYLFISHDLRVVKFMSDRVAVMKEGKIIEEGPTSRIYSNPERSYTKLLLSSILNIYPKAYL